MGKRWGSVKVALTRNDRKESDRNAQSQSRTSTNNAAPEQSPMTWSNSMGCRPAVVMLIDVAGSDPQSIKLFNSHTYHRADEVLLQDLIGAVCRFLILFLYSPLGGDLLK